MKTRIEIHPAAKMMPPMSDDEYESLKADIKTCGLKMPVMLHEGKIIDGIHRRLACEELGITLRTVKAELNGQTPGEFVWSMNGPRRHLTTSQRSMIAANMKEQFEAEAAARKKAGKKAEESDSDLSAKLRQGKNGQPDDLSAKLRQGRKSAERAAAMVNVSSRSVESAVKVVEDGAKALQDAVNQGDVPVSAAAKLATLPKAKQTAVVKAGPEAVRRAVAKVDKKKSGKKPASEHSLKSIDKRIEDLYGKLIRLFDARSRSLGTGRDSYWKAVDDSMASVLADFKNWKRAKVKE